VHTRRITLACLVMACPRGVHGWNSHELTRCQLCADIANAIFTTAPAVALIITLVLDNTIPGTIRERGLHVWLRVKGAAENWWDDDSLHDVSPQALLPSGCGWVSCSVHGLVDELTWMHPHSPSACVWGAVLITWARPFCS